jgi:hypothetical protein
MSSAYAHCRPSLAGNSLTLAQAPSFWIQAIYG